MNNILFNKVSIITVAKVGSANFLSCNYAQTKNVRHGHSLLELKRVLNNESDCMIIVGIRNPIDRNLYYLFQTCWKFNDHFNDVKTKKNNYLGEYCYIPEITEESSAEDIINLYFKQKYHNTFNEWFEEFLEITNITKFDKDKGVDFYNFPNNNTIMIYTMEKLSENNDYIVEKLGIIDNFKNINDSKDRLYKTVYKEVKQKIVYNKEYLNNLLNTKIMKIFYNESVINNFFKKYNIN